MFQAVTNTYSKYDVFSNYIGGSIGLQAFVDGLYINVLHRQGKLHDETGASGPKRSSRASTRRIRW